MTDGFIRVAAVTPDLRVADVSYNQEKICEAIGQAFENKASIVAFPELCITGYTCGDLFTQETLLKSARKSLYEIAGYTKGKKGLVFIGVPLSFGGALYNVSAAVSDGKILGLTTKSFLPNYGEFYEMRQFVPGPQNPGEIILDGQKLPFGPGILYVAEEMEELVVSAEICEDLWSVKPPSIEAAREGAVLIINSSASDEIVGKEEYRKQLISGQSARLLCGYVYANAGSGESTTDLVFGGECIIAENGVVLRESGKYQNGIIFTEIDVERLLHERRYNTTFRLKEEYQLPRVPFSIGKSEMELCRVFDSRPFIPGCEDEREKRCEAILMIQAMGLKKRLLHTGAKAAVVGISGGLDSTLALLVTTRAFDILGLDRKEIVTVTMPCFGTTDRTYNNACLMAEKLGVTLREIRIKDAVLQHFKDIGQDENNYDVTFENAQARERTQVLMDVANQCGGLVVGTGDMSELALGWATYNGDHMSMYGVNASVPKTLVRHLVEHCAKICEEKNLSEALYDVLNTPVSPELLPPDDGEIAQKTEDLVGPYELHDFFMYYMLRFGYSPKKIYRIACLAFEGEYSEETIRKWLKTFCRRFFSQQFKRSCLPDGPKVGSVSLSPRGDLRMPSDACSALWMDEIEMIK